MAAALFAALATLITAGSLARVDEWSVDRLMPGLAAVSADPSLVNSAFPIFDPDKHHGHEAVAALTYAVVWIASALPALFLVALAIVVLWWRTQRSLAIGLAAVFIAANLIEIVGKAAITRPTLIHHTATDAIPVTPFDHSLPSGHAIRAVFLVAGLIAIKPKLWPLGLTWLAFVTIMLVAGGWHTPTDVAAGLLIATAAIAACLNQTTVLKRT